MHRPALRTSSVLEASIALVVVALASACDSVPPHARASVEPLANSTDNAANAAHGSHATGAAAAQPGANGESWSCPNPGNAAAAAQPERPRDPRAPIATRSDGTRVFGRESALTATASLPDILGTPARFTGQTVRTSGVVRQVCQRMGCWMELAAETSQAAGARPVFVRMAGHAFLLPRDVVGRRATAEGRITLRPLSPNEIAHYNSEGASLAEGASTVELEATTVEILPADAARPASG